VRKEILKSARNGKLIELNNPQPEVRKNAENAKDWAYADEAVYLYRMAVLFRDRFLDPILLIDRRRLPDLVISFANLRNKNTLAAYTLVRNPQGLLYEITMKMSIILMMNMMGKRLNVGVLANGRSLRLCCMNRFTSGSKTLELIQLGPARFITTKNLLINVRV